MKITTVLILVLLLLLFSSCDFLVYYTFLSSETNKVTYNPQYPDQIDMFPEYDGGQNFYSDDIFYREQSHENPLYWYGEETVDPEEDNSLSPISVAEKFSLIILPDTQYYTAYYPHIYTSQLEWIAGRKENLNIAFVLHEGDIVHNNTVREWETARTGMKILDGLVPYAVAAGNHDIGLPGRPSVSRDTTLFNAYFPMEQYQHLSNFGGVYEAGKMENSYHFFRAGGIDWLVLVLEFGRRDEVLEWAHKILYSYNNRKVILLTHSYMYYDDSLHGSKPTHQWTPDAYGISYNPGNINSGEDIWKKLVYLHNNVVFVFSGHIMGDGTGLLVSTTPFGNKVYQMLANYQMYENGGNGYLRILECDPENRSVSVTTYSPFTGMYLTDRDNNFVFKDVDFFN